MAGQGCGLEPRGELCPGFGPASGEPAPESAPPILNPELPARLQVALVDGDEGVHDFVRKAFAVHAEGWVLETHRTADSVVGAPGCAPATPHAAQNNLVTNPGAARSNVMPEVVLMAVLLPELSGIECARRFAACQPSSRIVMFTTCTDPHTIVRSVMAGVFGYLIKPVPPEHLVRAIGEVAQGRLAFCAKAQAALLNYLHRMGRSEWCKKLSEREREIMLHLMKGLPNKVIASELGIGAGTLHKHLDNIYKKLGVHGKDAARRKFMAGE